MNKIEFWKDIPEYEGLYQASNLGRIKRLAKENSKGFKEKIHNPVLQKTGYLLCALSKNKISKKYLAHRIIAKTFIENKFNKEQINHKNGIKNDNRIENLEWFTRSENTKHAWQNGLIKLTDKMLISLDKGRRHNAKLTDEEVLDIRNTKYYFGMYKELSIKYKVTEVAINKVYKYKTYKNGNKN